MKNNLEYFNWNASNSSNSSSAGILDKNFSLEHFISPLELLLIKGGGSFTIITNFLLALFILCKPKYRRPANYMLVYLSISSGVWMVINLTRLGMQMQVIDLYFLHATNNDIACRFWIFINRISVTTISLSTMAISEERITVIRNPLIRVPKDHCCKRMLFITFYAIVISFPIVFCRELDTVSKKCKKILIGNSETLALLHILWQLSTVSILPTVKLLYEHWKTRFQIKYLLTKEGRQVLTEDRRQKLFLTSCMFSVIFLFCWTPYGIFLSLKDIPNDLFPSLDLERKTNLAFKMARALILFHVGINPILFIMLNYNWTCKGLLTYFR